MGLSSYNCASQSRIADTIDAREFFNYFEHFKFAFCAAGLFRMPIEREPRGVWDASASLSWWQPYPVLPCPPFCMVKSARHLGQHAFFQRPISRRQLSLDRTIL
jgi:hypothetical protein